MSAIPFHHLDPDAIATANPQVLDYIATIERLGREAPPPTSQVAYGPDRAQRLDVYAPPGAKDLPMLVFFHGGAWINGHLGWLRFMAPAVTALPAILVAGTYRLAPRCKWPAQIEDVAAAVRFVHAHAREWGGDPERIVTGGHSAGGQLTALASLQVDSPPLAACFPVSCPFSLEHGDVPLESEPGRVYRYLFDPRSQDAEASPLRTIQRARQPFHILWGDDDLDYVISSSREAVTRLEAAGGNVTFAELPGSSHFDAHVALGNSGSPWYAQLSEAFA